MSIASRTACQACIRSGVTKCVPYASCGGAYVFVSERGRLIQRLGKTAKMPFRIHPHMLRHACGYKLANDGHDTRALQHYLGHKNIQHTVRYTELAVDRFKDFWR